LEECNYPLAKSGYLLHILARSGVKGGPSALRRDKPPILIVDDDFSDARIIRKLLGTEDYEIVTGEFRSTAIGPACELPMWIQYFRPRAAGRIESSARLLLNSSSGYSSKRVRYESCGVPEFPQWDFRL
jgi:hypothetical protein